MCPLLLGLAAVSEPFVSLLLTEKWLPCVPLMRLFCIFYLFQPIHTANTQAIKALGRSDICFKLEIIRDVIQLVVLFCVMWISVEAIVVSMAACSIAFIFINAHPNIKLIGYNIKEQMSDILPNVAMSGFMAMVVYTIGYLPVGNLPKLILQVTAGAIIYIVLSVVVKNKEFVYLKNMIFKKFCKKKEQ